MLLNCLDFKQFLVQFKIIIKQLFKEQARNTKMKIPLNDIVVIYEKIVADINIAEISMVIFTALDVDALCTLKILSRFLKNENILHKIYPVSSYTQLEEKIQDCKNLEKIKLFFFINCGGLIDLSSKWISKQAQVFLFDINKPIHHANIEATNIKIVDDKFSQLQKAPTLQEMDIYENYDDDLMEEMEEKQHQLEEDEEKSEEQQIVAKKRKRAKSSQQAMRKIQKIRKIKNEIGQKVQQYYSKQFFGLPSSYIAYKMMKDLNKADNSYLWFAVVGFTGMFLQQKIQKDEVQSINGFYMLQTAKLNTILRQQQKNGNNLQKNSLRKKLDFQFPLLRHWSLYESIQNSPYMIAKLGIWDQDGNKKLKQLLSLMGLSLEQSQQLYKYMLNSSIKKLQQKIFTCAKQFKLFDAPFQSFARQVDYAFQMTASDYYYILSSVIQKPAKNSNFLEVIEHRTECFLEAYDLFSAGQSKLELALQQAKKMLKIYTKQEKNIIQRNHIMNGDMFSFVNIPSDTEDKKLFEHPFSLTRLAQNLMMIYNQKRKKRAFIASIQNKQTQTSQIVGVMTNSKNQFSYKFNLVIQKLNIDVRMDSFMNNVMTVPKDSLIQIIRSVAEL